MAGINITGKGNMKATNKLLSSLVSYKFEQEYDEMKNLSQEAKQAITKAIEEIGKCI